MDKRNTLWFRPELVSAEKVAHGGKNKEGLIDFSVCVNPFPLPGEVVSAFQSADISRYPDSEAFVLANGLSDIHGCSPDEILVCNGISQAIFLIAFVLLDRGRRVLIAGPTYGEYEKNCRLMGADIRRINSRPEDGFSPAMDELIRDIRQITPSVVWICNPNNPTGVLLSSREISDLTAICAEQGSYLVIDEAYMNFVAEGTGFSAAAQENIIVLRSLTKDFAVPGLRLGYVKADPKIIRLLQGAQPEWSLNSPSLAAGAAALQVLDEYRSQWEQLRRETERLTADLANLRFDVFPGKANFLLIRDTERGGINCNRFSSILLKEGLILRDCSSFGLKGYMRIGTSLPQYNRRLVEVLELGELWEE